MKVTAIAHSNIALVKYWGKRDESLKLPYNNSISITLDQLQTRTTIDFDSAYKEDVFVLNGERLEQSAETLKLQKYVNYLRQQAGVEDPLMFQSENNFPTGAGLASSASGFAALTVAGAHALGLELTDCELSMLARQGSGSACRSLFGGFVEWQKGESQDGSDSYAVQIAPPTHWDLQLFIVISSQGKKQISSTQAMRSTVETSPYYQGWIDSIDADLENVRQGIQTKNLQAMGETAEENCLKMHALMLSTIPPLLYWNETTLTLIKRIRQWRQEGLPCYFTIDAGPNVVVFCTKGNAKHLKNRLSEIDNIQQIIECRPGPGPTLSKVHLF